MKAVGYTTPGPESVFKTFELEKPTAEGHDLLVEVNAVSVNPVDTKARANRPPLTDQPAVLGFDAVGVVAEVGDLCTRFQPGDRVWYAGDFVRQGTNAELHLVDERIVGRAPTSLSDAEGAAMPLTSLTAWEGLFDRMRVDDPIPGAAPAVLIIGGAGGVGSMAIQLLRALTDLTVIATASRPETIEWATDLGAHHVINHHEPLAEQVEALGLGQPGFVFSTTHTQSYLAAIADLMAPQGRFGFIDRFPDFDITLFFPKCISIHPELMFTRPMQKPADIGRQGEILDELAALVEAGKVRTTMTESFGTITPENLGRAHAKSATNTVLGKLVLEGF
jgi:zinc-binding alcohol dehydrogenase family protein